MVGVGRVPDPICGQPIKSIRMPHGHRKGQRVAIYITFPIPMFERIRQEAFDRGISFSSLVTEMLHAAEGLANDGE